ncbi:MAG TPA: replication protein RepA [Azospirillum sp.]|nr:replication protein RepA [Azospirillum sp.]
MISSGSMAEIHDLVRQHGRDEARRLVPAEERHLVDMAAAMLAIENPTLGITYSGFCLTALPHRKLPDDQRWERQGHQVRLVVEPGVLPSRDGATQLYGVPYGSRARLIILYLQTRAIQTNSPEVELGASMREWMGRMGVSGGGKQYRDVRDQANRISACNLTFIWHDRGSARFQKDSIVRGGIQLYEQDEEDQQMRLWVDTVRLSDSFFTALRDHPVPVAEPALRQIANNSTAIDAYIWLAYRLHSLERPTPVTWAALYQQFGGGYAQLRQFKARFLEPLREALAVYPDAKVEVDDTGLVLHPSRPPILGRTVRLLI